MRKVVGLFFLTDLPLAPAGKVLELFPDPNLVNGSATNYLSTLVTPVNFLSKYLFLRLFT